ncbi:bacterioferritin [Aquihabitans sp. McL0605]|uniref:bacterioferritin n=1 Tax=Aquihabitans sp. McL0605 TaxID=3415671 RepID=UPI003CF6D9F3
MQGDPEIIEALNEILTAELTAINQYFIHAKMRENWGFKRLAAVARKESIEEMEDADKIIERILYFDGVPNLQRYNPILVGETVPEQLALELETEKAAIERYNRHIALAVAKGDNGSRELMEHRLVDEESHADWLEAQLHLIETIGAENYLAQQLHDDD